jgi:hypothetical protein
MNHPDRVSMASMVATVMTMALLNLLVGGCAEEAVVRSVPPTGNQMVGVSDPNEEERFRRICRNLGPGETAEWCAQYGLPTHGPQKQYAGNPRVTVPQRSNVAGRTDEDERFRRICANLGPGETAPWCAEYGYPTSGPPKGSSRASASQTYSRPMPSAAGGASTWSADEDERFRRICANLGRGESADWCAEYGLPTHGPAIGASRTVGGSGAASAQRQLPSMPTQVDPQPDNLSRLLGAQKEQQQEELSARRQMQQEELNALRQMQQEELNARRQQQNTEMLFRMWQHFSQPPRMPQMTTCNPNIFGASTAPVGRLRVCVKTFSF